MSFCFRWKLLRNLEFPSFWNSCLYHSSFVNDFHLKILLLSYYLSQFTYHVFIIRPFFLYFYNMHYFDRHFFNFSIHSRILFLNKCFPGYIHQNLPPVPHFRTKSTLKHPFWGLSEKIISKYPAFYRKRGPSLKFFYMYPWEKYR